MSLFIDMAKSVEIRVLVTMKDMGFFTKGQEEYDLIVEVDEDGNPILCEVEWHLMFVEKIDLKQIKKWEIISCNPFSYTSTST